MTYEELQMQHHKINIVEMDLSEVNGLKGLCCDGNIAIEKSMSSAEKSCILAEELGHHYTSSGNILDQTRTSNRKQEYRARLYGYNLKIGLMGFVRAYEAGCRNLYEMADYLDVTEEYLKEAIACYTSKYGRCVAIDNYAICFEPWLAIAKITE